MESKINIRKHQKPGIRPGLSVLINPDKRKISFLIKRRPLIPPCPPRRRGNEIFRFFIMFAARYCYIAATGAAADLWAEGNYSKQYLAANNFLDILKPGIEPGFYKF